MKRSLSHVIVTGAAGFVGSTVVQLLLRDAVRVTAVDDLSKGDRRSLPDDAPGFTFVRADLRDRAAALSVITGGDWVIHLASQAFGVGYGARNHSTGFLLNAQINANVVEATIVNGVPGLLAASSSCVYPHRNGAALFTEDDGFEGQPEAANHGYGWAKRMLEVAVLEAVRDGKCEAVIVRPVNIYGASYGWFGADSHVIPSLVKRMLDGENPLTIWGDGSQVRNFIHVRDVAHAMIELSCRAPSSTVVNLGPEEPTTINEILEILQQELNVSCSIVRDLSRPTGPVVKNVSVHRLRELLPDYHPRVGMREGLREMRSWYERHKQAGHFA